MGSEFVDDIAIRAVSLGKRYRLRESGGVGGLVEVVGRRLRGRNGQDLPPAPPNEFWALQDVSFDIRKGEVVGIIGHNGAGKSTLLKVLTRITNPTEGSASVRGRVGMLLEVGTGFHPDLTGRENVFLGGAILGMTRQEIRRKYDDIVDFAEMHGFMDTPVRHYSSGMSLRLALSVAVHLDAEVIFLDEIWAVGDHAFQYKTWRRIEELISSGRTFVLVVHNLTTIERLCTRCLLMDHGRLTMDSSPAEVIARYREELRQRNSTTTAATNALRASAGLEIVEARLVEDDVQLGETLDCRLTLDSRFTGKVSVAISVRDTLSRTLAVGTLCNDQTPWVVLPVVTGHNGFRCTVPAIVPAAHTYDLLVEIRSEEGLAASAEIPFTVAEREVVIEDDAGNGQSVPALSIDWTVVAPGKDAVVVEATSGDRAQGGRSRG